jgi:hypothetical protein
MRLAVWGMDEAGPYQAIPHAVNLDQKLRDLHTRLKSGRYQAPVIRRV